MNSFLIRYNYEYVIKIIYIYYWKCTKQRGATIRTIFDHSEHKQDDCSIINDHY
jgi:hypothetical protein